MGYAIEMATEIRPGYRYEAPSMVGRVPAAREKVALLCSLACASEANYKIRYLLTSMHQLTNLLHPESQFFGNALFAILPVLV